MLPGWIRPGIFEPLVRRIPVTHDRMSLHFKAQSFLRGAHAPAERAHQLYKEVFSAEERRNLLTPALYDRLKQTDPFDAFSQHAKQYQSMSEMDRLLYLDYKVFLPDCTLAVVDLATSAHAVECR